MKWAMITSSFDSSLQEEGFITAWVEGLAGQVDELVLILLNPPVTAPQHKNIRIYSLSSISKIGKVVQLFRILSQEHQSKPFDCVFTHIYDFLAVFGGVWGKINQIRTLFWHAGGLDFSPITITGLAMKLNDVIVTCSQQEANRYAKNAGISSLKIKVLGHAVDTDYFKAIAHKSDGHHVIGSIGRATPQKNFLTLVKAVANVKTEKPLSLKLALSRLDENNEYFSLLSKEIDKARKKSKHQYEIINNVTYHTLPQFYASLNLYIHPSKLLSVDKAGLEAVACGLPTLLSSAGYTEVVGDYKQILFDPSDIDQLTRKIEAVLHGEQLPAAQLQSRIVERYGIYNFMKRLVKLAN